MDVSDAQALVAWEDELRDAGRRHKPPLSRVGIHYQGHNRSATDVIEEIRAAVRPSLGARLGFARARMPVQISHQDAFFLVKGANNPFSSERISPPPSTNAALRGPVTRLLLYVRPHPSLDHVECLVRACRAAWADDPASPWSSVDEILRHHSG
jgi:hypothetical protein